MEIDFTSKIRAFDVDKITYEETREELSKQANNSFQVLKINFDEVPIIEPPKNSSTSTKEELYFIKSFQEEWTPSESLLKKCDDYPDGIVTDFCDKIYGGDSKKEYKISQVMEDVNVFIMRMKMFYKRARPYQLSEYHEIDINFDKKMQNKGTANTPSYPSGHTASAFLAANICGYFHPAAEKEFLRIAETVGKSRIKEGVHFQSDNEYSKILVNQVLMPAYLSYSLNE
tara:strand:- start:5200 stop:5886 length:687 start_codon:yes stop_codon:yes gene_type:complete